MLETLARYWWAVALRGAAAVIFGLMALIWPAITITALVLLFRAYAIVDGVVTIGTALFGAPASTGRRIWLAVQGVVGIIAGVVTFAWPGITTLVLLFVIATWAVVTGALEIFVAVRLRRELQGEWLLILSGALSVVFGVLMFVWPDAGALALTILIGAYALVAGLTMVMLGLRLRGLRLRGLRGTAPKPVTV
jgi:uncharacterized membrane protein HdeD (DUF308 family)